MIKQTLVFESCLYQLRFIYICAGVVTYLNFGMAQNLFSMCRGGYIKSTFNPENVLLTILEPVDLRSVWDIVVILVSTDTPAVWRLGYSPPLPRFELLGTTPYFSLPYLAAFG